MQQLPWKKENRIQMTNKKYSEQQILELIKQFNDRSLPKTGWTHESHLVVAVWHICSFDFFEAVCKLRSGIILLNSVHQTENTGNTGYHETLTIFWSKVIHAYISLNKEFTMEELVDGYINSPLAERNLPFEFYDKETLLSSGLRAVYAEPNKKVMCEAAIKKILGNDNQS